MTTTTATPSAAIVTVGGMANRAATATAWIVTMNKNYQAGRRVEYEVIAHWKEQGYSASRTAGSHGTFDVVAYRYDRKPEFIQCKRTTTLATANRLIKNFKETTTPSLYYHQTMWVKVKGSKGQLTGTI